MKSSQTVYNHSCAYINMLMTLWAAYNGLTAVVQQGIRVAYSISVLYQMPWYFTTHRLYDQRTRWKLSIIIHYNLYYRPISGAQSCITVKHQILNHKNHDPWKLRHHLIHGVFRSWQEKNATFTCNFICKTTLKSTHQIRGMNVMFYSTYKQ